MPHKKINISIVIPLYNKERYIKETLKSIQSQTYESYEIVIVDDGSTDDGLNIIKQINDPRIRLLEQENNGVSVARNLGAELANGEILVFLDADDMLSESYLETMRIAFTDTKTIWAMCSEKKIYDDSYQPANIELVSNFKTKNYYDLFMQDKCGCPATIALRREEFLNSGGFIRGIKNGEDVEFWLRFASKHPSMEYIDNELVYYRAFTSDGATVKKRSQESLIMFWESMDKIYTSCKENNTRQLIYQCTNKFADKAYRFYIRDGYCDAANYLWNMTMFKPSILNYIFSKSPLWLSKIVLGFIYRLRQH